MSKVRKTTTLLIAEDDAALGELLREAFEASGYAVFWTRKGDEALELAASMRFDIVLSDIVMPGADGLKLLAQIGHDPVRTIVILMTGYSSITDAVDAARRGAWDFVSKPFSLPELQLRVDNARRYQQALRRIRALEAELERLRAELTQLLQRPEQRWAAHRYGTKIAEG